MKKLPAQYKLISKRAVKETASIPASWSAVSSSLIARDIAMFLWDKETIEVNEHFAVMYMNTRAKVVGWAIISEGGSCGTVVDIKNIFTIGLLIGAQSIICFHNHPSGSLNPSNQDREITQKIKKAGEVMEMNLLDHIILASDKDYYSFADNGAL